MKIISLTTMASVFKNTALDLQPSFFKTNNQYLKAALQFFFHKHSHIFITGSHKIWLHLKILTIDSGQLPSSQIMSLKKIKIYRDMTEV